MGPLAPEAPSGPNVGDQSALPTGKHFFQKCSKNPEHRSIFRKSVGPTGVKGLLAKRPLVQGGKFFKKNFFSIFFSKKIGVRVYPYPGSFWGPFFMCT